MGTTTTVTVRIANFPIDATGHYGRIDGLITVEAEIVRFAGSRNQVVTVRLVHPPLPYQHGEVLCLDVLDDGTYGPLELIGRFGQ